MPLLRGLPWLSKKGQLSKECELANLPLLGKECCLPRLSKECKPYKVPWLPRRRKQNMKRYEKDTVQSHPVFAKIRKMVLGDNPTVNAKAESFAYDTNTGHFAIRLPRNKFWCKGCRKLKREGEISSFDLGGLVRNLVILGLLTEDEMTSLWEARREADEQQKARHALKTLESYLGDVPPELKEPATALQEAIDRYHNS